MISHQSRSIHEVKEWDPDEIYDVGEKIKYYDDIFVVQLTHKATRKAVPGSYPEYYKVY